MKWKTEAQTVCEPYYKSDSSTETLEKATTAQNGWRSPAQRVELEDVRQSRQLTHSSQQHPHGWVIKQILNSV